MTIEKALVFSVNRHKPVGQDILGWEVSIGEPNSFLQIILVNVAKHSVHSEIRRRIPDVVDRALEGRRKVRHRQLPDSSERTLEPKPMTQAFRGVLPIRMRHEVGVIRRKGTVGQELVQATVGYRVVITANDERDLGAI